MFRRRRLTSNETLALGVFGGLSLLGLLGMIAGAVTPTGAANQVEPQTAALCLGPFAGGLGAMALIAFRTRVGKPGPLFVAAIVAWFIGVSLLGFGIFNAFNPGDMAALPNFGLSIALCSAPGLFFCLLAIAAFWRGELRTPPPEVDPMEARGEAAGSYADIERRAVEYRRGIEQAVRDRRRGPLKDALLPALDNLDEWEARIRQLTGWLRVFDGDGVTHRDLREVPAAIARLEAQLATERDAAVREQLQDTLAGYRAQGEQLAELGSAERRTRLQLDEALSALGRIYSQLQLFAAKELDSASARSIADDIEAQTARLDDLLSSVDETYRSAEARPRLDAATGG